MPGDGSNPSQGGANGGDASRPLTYLCESCVTAFETVYDFCPTCNHPRPSDGWRETHHYPDNWLGRSVDRYRIERRLGKGTFGAVYLARRPHLEDAYAIKIINLHDANFPDEGPTIRERVQREVRILSSLSSPHIVDFQDFLELPGGAVAVVMDYVQGETLAEVLADEETFELDRAIQFAIEIATALARAHERGAVHRDLKPDNVMVREPGDPREFVQLIDFGVARFEFEVSQTVGFIGTPRYTSPEQARGESTDHTSDVYNLGMLLFHMLTGQPPFPGNDVNQLLRAHSMQPAPGLAETAEDRTIPEELDELVTSMMAKAPDQRPDDMRVVADRLRAIRARAGQDDDARKLGESSSPAIETDNPGFGPVHETDDHPTLDGSQSEAREGGGFAERPPSDVYDVSAEGSIVYRDDDNRLQVRGVGEAPDDDEELFARFPTPVTALAVDGPGRVLLGYEDGTIRTLDLETRDVDLLREDAAGSAVTAVAETPDGTCVAIGYEDGRVEFRDRREKDGWCPLPTGTPVLAIGIYHDGSCLAVGREDGTTDVYMPARSVRDRCTQLVHEARPENVEFSPDGYLVAVQFPDGDAKLFSALTGAHLGEASSSLLEPSSVFEDARN